MLRFVGDGDQKKFTKNPRHFSMQISQAKRKKIHKILLESRQSKKTLSFLQNGSVFSKATSPRFSGFSASNFGTAQCCCPIFGRKHPSRDVIVSGQSLLKKTPKLITSHDVLEPLKQVLLASRDLIFSGQICGSKLSCRGFSR